MTDTYIGAINTVAVTIEIGDGATVENFAHPCSINTSRGISGKAQTVTNSLFDCTDPTKPAISQDYVQSVRIELSGAGVHDHAATKAYMDWLVSGKPKNVKAYVGKATGDLTITGAYILTQYDITGGEPGKFVECQIALMPAGAPTITAHA